MTAELNTFSQILLGVGLAAVVALAAWKARSLSNSGAWAAWVSGSVIFGLGGLRWAALLLTFFITSSGLSKLFGQRKQEVSEKFSKGSRRDWAQVFANGGVATFMIGFHLLYPDSELPWLAFAGALAAANADTWATELGVFSLRDPRMITSGKQVPKGTSGGISLVGTLATTAGAGLIGFIGWLFTQEIQGWAFIGVVTIAGLLGSLVDSLLGATVQAIYYDPGRKKETEKIVKNQDGSPAAPSRGLEWINNDMVNFSATLCGALIAAGLWKIFV